ncbi:MAG: molybdate ABC transporter substrate-binding protein [Chitinispirillaceae bacterium]
MKVRITPKRIVLILFIFSTFTLKADPQITIAAAASTAATVQRIGEAFQQKTGIRVNIVTGSSGKLTVQILNGGPYDVFMAADMNHPLVLYSKGKATDPPRRFASGILVLWTRCTVALENLAMLKSKDIRRIAVPTPELAPFGSEAIQVLKLSNIYDTVKNKLVYASNVNQTTQYVANRAADVGFVSLSKVIKPRGNNGNYLIIPDSLSKSIPHGIVIVKKQGDRSQAEAFYEFVFTRESQNLLQSDGYLAVRQNGRS